MFKHYFERIEGIELFPVISLLIFFVFFVVLALWVVNADKNYILTMKNLPLEASTNKIPGNEPAENK